jgi:hypothetical protein
LGSKCISLQLTGSNSSPNMLVLHKAESGDALLFKASQTLFPWILPRDVILRAHRCVILAYVMHKA